MDPFQRSSLSSPPQGLQHVAAPPESVPPSEGGAAPSPPSKVVHARGLAPRTSEADIRVLCTRLGLKVVGVFMFSTKGQALIELDSVQSASVLLRHSTQQPTILNGRQVYLQFSSYQALEPPAPSPFVQKEVFGHRSAQHQQMSQPSALAMQISPNPGPILLVSILEARLPVSIENLHTVFQPYGDVLRIVMFMKQQTLKALVEMGSVEAATNALMMLDGKDMFLGCCHLRVTYSTNTRLSVRQNGPRSRDFTSDYPSQQQQQQQPQSGGNNKSSMRQQYYDAAAAAGYAFSGYPPSPSTQSPGGSALGSPMGGSLTSSPVDPHGVRSLGLEVMGAGGGGGGGRASGRFAHRGQQQQQQQQMAVSGDTTPRAPMHQLLPLAPHQLPTQGVLHSPMVTPPSFQRTLPVAPAALASNALSAAVMAAATSGGDKGTVLLVNNLVAGAVIPDHLFMLFGVYGDVQRVKILFNKRHTALVQLAHPYQAYLAHLHLNHLVLHGKELNIGFSKHGEISMPRLDDEAGQRLTKDYSKSPVHRFAGRNQRNSQNIHPPSTVLHVSNLYPGATVQELQSLFHEAIAVAQATAQAEAQSLAAEIEQSAAESDMENKSVADSEPQQQQQQQQKSASVCSEQEQRTVPVPPAEGGQLPLVQFFPSHRRMAFVKCSTLHDAVLALVTLHNHRIQDCYMRICFSNKSPAQVIENLEASEADLRLGEQQAAPESLDIDAAASAEQ